MWLILNLFAMSHFVTASLRFVQPGERQAIQTQIHCQLHYPTGYDLSTKRRLYILMAPKDCPATEYLPNH